MTTASIASSRRRNVQRSRWSTVVAFSVVWYGALLAAAVLPQSASAAGGQAARAVLQDTAQTNRVPGNCSYFWCR